jgi:hypothetical protein
MSSRQVVDGYTNRFGMEGTCGILLLIYNFITAFVAITIVRGLDIDPRQSFLNFITLLALFHAGTVALDFRVIAGEVMESMYYATTQLVYHSTMLVVCIIVRILAPPAPLAMLFISLLCALDLIRWYIYGFIGRVISERIVPLGAPRQFTPVHVALTAERFGLLIIVCIAYCLLTRAPGITVLTVRSMSGAGLACIQGYLFKLSYYDCFECGGGSASRHALRISRERGFQWTYFHLLSVIGVILSLSLVSHVFYAQGDASTDVIIVPAQQYLYSTSFAIVLFSFWNIRNAHELRRSDVTLLGLSEGAWVYLCVAALVCSGHFAVKDPMILQVVFVLIFGIGSFIGIVAETLSPKQSLDVASTESNDSSVVFGARQNSYGSLQQSTNNA